MLVKRKLVGLVEKKQVILYRITLHKFVENSQDVHIYNIYRDRENYSKSTLYRFYLLFNCSIVNYKYAAKEV